MGWGNKRANHDESITHERPDPEGEAPTERVTEAPDTRINSAGEVVRVIERARC
jgi:hypothetical protein